jgi:hypothetical protein
LSIKSRFGFDEVPISASITEDFDDRFHNIKEVAEENNYTFSEYNITTVDGYILSLHRITKGKVNA